MMVFGVFAQIGRSEAPFLVREWHREDGLPSEVVTNITQDREGYLWIVTSAGIARFDGNKFTLHVVPDEIHASRSSMIGILAHADGLKLIPRSGDSLIFHRGEFKVEPLRAPYSGSTILAAFLAPDGSEWFALREGLLIRCTGGTIIPFDRTAVGSIERTRFASDGGSRVWISHDKFLGRYENGVLVPFDVDKAEGTLRLASSRSGGPWIVTNNAVLKLNAEDRPEMIARLPTLLGAHYIQALCEDASGALWIGTRSQGLHRITKSGVEHVPTSHDSITALHEDLEGNIWVGTNSGGLNAICPKIHQLYDKTRGLIENAVYSLCELPDGSIWCANGDGGLVRIADDGVTVVSQRVPFPRTGFVSVAPSPRGSLLLGGSQGVYEFNPSLQESPKLVLPVRSGVRRMYVDRQGGTWLAIDPAQLGHLSRDGSYTVFGADSGLSGGDVRCFSEDDMGNLWIGTSQGALLRRENMRFVREDFSAPARIGAINAIHFTEDNSQWLATAQAGLVIVRGGNARILDASTGMPENNLTQITSDKLGFVWVTSNTGIFRLDPVEVKQVEAGAVSNINAVRLTRNDGLKALSSTGNYSPNSVRGSDGRLWFATRQGALVVDPSASLLDAQPRRVAIESFSADSHFERAAPRATVSPKTKRLQIHFSILCLSAPQRANAQYRLEGFDPDWMPVDGTNVANYPRLPAGTYTFRVRASPNRAAASSIEDMMIFDVPPLWWQTWWFVVLATLFIVAVVGAAVRTWSIRRLRQKLQKVEGERAVEQERARIAQNIHDDVGASLTHISLLTQVADDGEVRDNLNQIYEATREITRSLDEIVWAVNPQNDTLESFADYLASNAQRFLGLARIRCRLDIPDHLPATPLNSQIRHHLFLCCREALNNIIKHSQATEASVYIAVEGTLLKVAIEDNGVGIAEDGREGNKRTRLGNGLRNMNERMEAVGGRCSIEHVGRASGTAVRISLNLYKR